MPNSSISVLHILPKLNVSGVTLYVLDIIKTLSQDMENINFSVVAEEGELASKFMPTKVYNKRVSSKNIFTIIKNAYLLKKICTKENIKLMHVHSRAPAWSVLLASKLSGVPYISTYHGTYGQNAIKWHYNQVMVKGKRVVAVSNFIKENILKYYPTVKEKTLLIHQGITREKFTITRSDLKVIEKLRNENLGNILFLPGRLSKIKGHAFMLRALNERNQACTVFINQPRGNRENVYLKDLEKIIKGGKVELKILMEEQKIGYHTANVVIVPSIKPEAFGRIALEALLCDRPILVADHGGIKDIITEADFLFKPEDKKDFIKKLDDLQQFDNSILKSKVNIQRNEAMRAFDQKKCAQRMLDLYKEVIDETNPDH